jgi:Ca2+-binding EF-hand superfamily protein
MDILLDDTTDDLTEKFKNVLIEIFTRFDEDKDGSLSDKELDAFTTACNGTILSADEKQDIKTHFQKDDKGNLTQEGFLEMYHMQTSADPKETWKDLKKLGYNKKLEKAAKEVSCIIDQDPNLFFLD